MEQYVVVNSKRKIMRDMKSAIGDDILRFIAELLTNSDDSYKRINNFVGEKKIIIRVEKDKRNKKNDDDDFMITIIDNAEGMSKESLHRIFATYGGDNAGGIHKKTRGIFGQGASDVLRAAAFEKKTAQIISIKDNKVTKLLYNMDDQLASQISLEDITNKNIIIIDDILDSGYTMNFLYNHLKQKNPKSIKLCVLLNKQDRRIIDIDADYIGFNIENEFVIGYGLDYDEKYRNLPHISYIKRK